MAQRTAPSADHVLVVGGGIGGLSAALAMARQGYEVTVLERAPAFVELGAGLQLAPNATRVLAGLGVLDEVVAAGVLPKRLVLASALTGKELTWLGLERFPKVYGAPYVVVHRSDLLDILVAACRASGRIELRPDTPVAEVDPGSDGATAHDAVRVRCADGAVHTGALLVGADGLHSLVRTLVSDDEPICAGYVAYRGAIPLDRSARPWSLDDVVAFIGPGVHFVQYPLRRGEIYNQVAVFRSDRYAAGDEEWGTPDELDRAYAGACDHVRTALTSIERHARWAMVDRLPLERWKVGRAVLLGDAAHPMLQYLAQGACQAIADAGALGRHLGRAAAGDVTVDGALAAYEAERLPVTATVQRHARLWGDLWHADGMFAAIRDAYLTERDPDDLRHVDPLYGEGRDRDGAAPGPGDRSGEEERVG